MKPLHARAQLWDALAVSLIDQISHLHGLQSPVKCSGRFWSCLLAIETTYCTSSVDQEVHTGFPVLL